MPHIHTASGQHDITTSAYMLREIDGTWRCLVHMHKKFGKLLQIGGHIELDETPWGALVREIAEESGYTINQLTLLQMSPQISHTYSIAHPLPISFNTHKVTDDHYHTDLGYAFIVEGDPEHDISPDESSDHRWLSWDEIEEGVLRNEIFTDVKEIYGVILQDVLPVARRLSAGDYITSDPDDFAV